MKIVHNNNGSVSFIKPDDGTITIRGNVAPSGYEVISKWSVMLFTPELERKRFYTVRCRKI